MTNFRVNKYDFKRFLVCPKFMWLMRHKNNPQVKNWVKNNLTFLDAEQEKWFFSEFQYKKNQPLNSELEIRAVSGILFEDNVIDYMSHKYKLFCFQDDSKLSSQMKKNFTEQIIQSGQYEAFHEPYFCYQKYVTKCDLLVKRHDGSFDLYEIKGVNKIKDRKRVEDFANDLRYQCWILEKLNYKIANAYIIHLDENYLRQDKLEPGKLFTVENCFNIDLVKKHDIEEDLISIFNYFHNSFDEMKQVLLNPVCWKQKTRFCSHIIRKIKSKYNWLNLYRLTRVDKAKLYIDNQGEEIDLEKIKIQDFNLTANQIRSIKVIQNLEDIIKDENVVIEQLKKYHFPIYFYDFETTAFAIPQFDNTSPWLHIPFQYSIHVVSNEDYDFKTNKNIRHLDYLTQNRADPRQAFLKQFLIDMSCLGKGTYVAYNASFERNILKKLMANMTLSQAETEQITEIMDKTQDIKDFFKDFNIYHKDFFGSLSIKKTLPAFIPKFNYDNLKIQKGDQASAIYFNYIYKFMNQKEWNDIRNHLQQYCGLDSLAMFLLYDKIKSLVLAPEF